MVPSPLGESLPRLSGGQDGGLLFQCPLWLNSYNMKKYILFLYELALSRKRSGLKSHDHNIIRFALVDEDDNVENSRVAVLTYRLEELEFIPKEEILKMLGSGQEGIIIERAEGGLDEKQVICRQILPGEDYIPIPKFTLTPMQKKVMDRLTDGLQAKEIAEDLKLSYHTVKNHIYNAYGKMEVKSVSEAVERYVRYRNVLN